MHNFQTASILLSISMAVSSCSDSSDFKPIDQGGGPNDNVVSMLIEGDANPNEILKAAKTYCASRQFCQVYSWSDAANRALTFPMLDRELNSMAFSYKLNKQTSYEEFAWNCATWPEKKPNCI